jgi:transposase
MSGFIKGEDRFQATLFPERLDDYVAEDSAVRVIDVFLDDLDLSGLGFKTQPNDTGRPAYHPSTMLKLFVYGYLNRVQSSRRLEIEAQRNVELMWLTGRLAPDFKTIADFRKDNGVAIRLVCREFVMLCKKLNLFANAFVAIDGSKFKAVNSRDRNFTRAKMKRRLMEVDASIDRYLEKLAAADQAEPAEDKSRTLEDKIAAMRKEMARLKKLEARMLEAPDKQVSLTDPDARSMKTRGTGIVGYNVQTAVDTKHHLIVAHEVTNKGSDRRQLANMAKQAKSVIDTEELTAVADRGYYRGEDILDCDKANIETYLPKPQTSGNQAKGQFGRDAFRYIAEDNEYECPAGLRLVQHSTTRDKGRTLHLYWTYKCRYCDIKAQCTSGVHRKMSRWEHEEVLDAAQKRLDQNPDMMRIRRTTVEHPFGTLKAWMGSTHFMTKTLDRVSTEMSLHVLAYNMKRMMNIIGTKPLIEAIRA